MPTATTVQTITQQPKLGPDGVLRLRGIEGWGATITLRDPKTGALRDLTNEDLKFVVEGGLLNKPVGPGASPTQRELVLTPDDLKNVPLGTKKLFELMDYSGAYPVSVWEGSIIITGFRQ